MIRTLKLTLLTISLVGFLAAGAVSQQRDASGKIRTDRDRREDVRQNVDQKTSDVMKEQKDVYLDRIKSHLDAFDKELDHVKDQAKNATGSSKTDLEKTVDVLKMKNDAAHAKYDALKSADATHWTAMRSDMDKTINDLDNAFGSKGYHVNLAGRTSGEEGKEYSGERSKVNDQTRADNTAYSGKSSSDRDAFNDRINARLDGFQKELDRLKDRADKAQGSAKVNLNRNIQVLEMKLAGVKAQFDKFKGMDTQYWSAAKTEIDRAINDLDKSYSSRGVSVTGRTKNRRP